MASCVSAKPLKTGHEKSLLQHRNSEAIVLEYLRPMLKASNKTARIYYQGACYGKEVDLIPFPKIEVQRPSKGESGLSAIKVMFKGDKDVSVSQDGSKIIKIRFGNVNLALLDTKIHHLSLTREEQYNATASLLAIKSSTAVQYAMKKLNLQIPQSYINVLEVQPTAGLPHMPSALKNITIDKALDLVTTTFNGIVIYGACTYPDGTKLFRIYFTGLEKS